MGRSYTPILSHKVTASGRRVYTARVPPYSCFGSTELRIMLGYGRENLVIYPFR